MFKRFAAIILIILFWSSQAMAAFPAVAAAGYSEETSDTTTHNVVVPTGIASGNLLLWQTCSDGSPTISNVPAGWNQMQSDEEATILKSRIYYKIATGSETDFTYNTDVGEKSINRMVRITGAHASTAPESNTTNNVSTTPNTASLTISGWSTEDTLWFSIYCMDRDAGTVNTYPTNYADNHYTDASGTGTSSSNVSIGWSSRNLAATTENPGAYTTNDVSSRRWYGYTIAIRPAAAAATSAKKRIIMIQ